jgi:hypothetical protein
MNLSIDGQIVAMGQMNLEAFRKEMQKSFKLRRAVMQNIDLKKNETGFEDTEVKAMMYYGVDWGQILNHWYVLEEAGKEPMQEMVLIMHNCTIDGHMQYNLNTKQQHKGKVIFEFGEERSARQDFLIAHNFIPHQMTQIETFLGQTLINYHKTNSQWKKTVLHLDEDDPEENDNNDY